MKRMVIVADSSFVIETIRQALRSSAKLEIIGKLDGRVCARGQIARLQPDVVFVDEMQNPDDARERIRESREDAPSAAILLLGMRMDDEWITQAIEAGVDACLSKSTRLQTLGLLIREVVDRRVVSAPPQSMGEVSLSGSADELTARELEILELVAAGMTNARIGRELWVTEQTVKFHLSNVYRKLGVSNRTEASRFAHVNRLVRLPPKPRLVAA